MRSLRLGVTDNATFDALDEFVRDATQQNEDRAALEERLQALGTKGAAVLKEVLKLLA